MIRLHEQNSIFRTPAKKKQKIILSTNIMGTPIAVEEVIYIIDTSLDKPTMYYW